ncbi:hypothetical protein BDP27DRAFT_1349693 [Rhodocollybia butyracea]|uniref:Uncharacterized protein n=1 Tax=Rhodocollybia butyracea TaxID=206335 RepID=A0A9P5TWZ3_9AGAR|nr:hypothetical protein BDP27DRAFT_1349693 [Rhodocollybia butyracea]
MADSFGISEAQLLTLFLCSVLWGMLLITSAYCLRGKLKTASTIHWLMLAMALVLLALCTFDVALLLMRGSAAEFTGLTNWVNILESCNIALGKLISDAILVYRCWIVSNRSTTLITFPALLWFGDVAMVIFSIFSEASQRNNPKVLLTEVAELQVAFTVAWGMSLVNNVLVIFNRYYSLLTAYWLHPKGFIVYRIWHVDNSLYAIRTEASPGAHPNLFRRSAHRKTRLQRVIRIIIESGLLYTTSAFITFITFLVRSNSFYTLSHAELQILSIAFNLIIIRVSTQPSGSESYVIQSSPTFPLRTFSAATNPSIALDTASPTKMNLLSGLRSSNEVLRNDSLLDP